MVKVHFSKSISGLSTSYSLTENLLKGVRADSGKVGARWPVRKSLAEAQSLKASPDFNRGFCNFGMAKAPSASTGVSFSNSRRFIALNLRSSVADFIER